MTEQAITVQLGDVPAWVVAYVREVRAALGLTDWELYLEVSDNPVCQKDEEPVRGMCLANLGNHVATLVFKFDEVKTDTPAARSLVIHEVAHLLCEWQDFAAMRIVNILVPKKQRETAVTLWHEMNEVAVTRMERAFYVLIEERLK